MDGDSSYYYRGEYVFEYKSEYSMLSYNVGFFNTIMIELKISRLTLEMFLRYVASNELELNITIINTF